MRLKPYLPNTLQQGKFESKYKQGQIEEKNIIGTLIPKEKRGCIPATTMMITIPIT